MPLQLICKAFFIVDRVFIFHLDIRVFNVVLLKEDLFWNNVLITLIVWGTIDIFLLKYFYNFFFVLMGAPV